MIRDIEFAMLTTVEADGSPRSCPIATHRDKKREFDGILWFFTRGDAPKIDEVKQDPHVNLSYASPDHSRYVSVSGTVMLVRDKKKAEEIRDPKSVAWFPNGLDDPELALLRVAVDKAEYWDTPGAPWRTPSGWSRPSPPARATNPATMGRPPFELRD